jgi:hypothetical protein
VSIPRNASWQNTHDYPEELQQSPIRDCGWMTGNLPPSE